jgi:hypothetical protein
MLFSAGRSSEARRGRECSRRRGPAFALTLSLLALAIAVLGPAAAAQAQAPTVTRVVPNFGPATGGTEVAITGTGFTTATAVDFGFAGTSFIVKSDTKITAVTPAGTGTVDVTVTTPEGISAVTSADQFTYVPEGPVVEKLSRTQGPVKGGAKVKVKGFNLAGATAVHYGAKEATSFTVESSKSIATVVPQGAGTVDVTVTTPEGTSPITPGDEYTYVSNPPGVSGVSPKQGPAAGGTVVQITGVNFLEATAVHFGSTDSPSFTVNTAKSITAVAPPETVARIEITVTTYYGTSAHEFCSVKIPCSIRDYYKYVEPTVTSVTPNSGPTSGGTPVTITGTGFAIGTTETSFSFHSAPATSVECTSINTCTAVTPEHAADTVDVRAHIEGTFEASAINPPGDQFTFE